MNILSNLPCVPGDKDFDDIDSPTNDMLETPIIPKKVIARTVINQSQLTTKPKLEPKPKVTNKPPSSSKAVDKI